MSSEFKIIGTSPVRPDALPKAAGTARYVADLDLPGAWIAGVLRSPVPAGRLKGIHKNPAFDWSRVCLITAADLPGPNVVAMVRDDYEILVQEKITYTGQALALLAAPDEALLAEALAALTPEIEPTTPALCIEDALAGVSRVWGEDNVMDEYRVACGDIDQGFAEAELILEQTYRTGLHEQLYLENQGMVARPRGEGLEVFGSLQCPYYLHKALAKALHLADKDLSVRQIVTGGAFGGKEDYPSVLAVWVGLLARATGQTVRLFYDREVDLLNTPKRHPSKTVYKMGLKKDGRITAVDVDLFLDGGANTTMTKVVLARACLHVTGGYKIPNARVRARSLATNSPPNGAFRGFGAPQALYAVERHLDLAAETLGLSPYAIRLKNALQPGDAFPFGQALGDNACASLVLHDAAERSDYERKRREYTGQKGRVRKGIGLSLCMHGGGFTGAGEDNMGTTVEVEYLPDGRLEVLSSSTDMGQGADTVLPMIAAEALGLPLDRVLRPLPDTARVPNSGPTVASRTTMFVGKVLHDACLNLIAKLADFLAASRGPARPEFAHGAFHLEGGAVASLDEAAEAFLARNGPIKGRAVFRPDPNLAWDEANYRGTAYKDYSWLAQAVEVEVDLDTYEIRPLRAWISTEVGRAVNPVQVTGQMEGGVLQSYGTAYLEDLTLRPDGRYSASRLSEYMIPTSLDAPEFELKVFEVPSPYGAFGAKGIGELSMDGGAPAVAAAVQNACGAFACEAPLTGERLFTLLEQLQSEPVHEITPPTSERARRDGEAAK